MKSVQIIICDDHPLITQGLQSFLENKSEFRICGVAKNTAELFDLLKKTEADILLLDVNLPDGNGIDICKEIKSSLPQLKIIGLSNFNERSVIIRMLNNGASGYLVKSSPMDEIVKAITEVWQGRIYLGKEAQNILASILSNESLELPPITKREKEVLEFLAQGLTSGEIADKMFISSQTVDSHRKNLMQKFEVNKTVNLLQKAKEFGILQ